MSLEYLPAVVLRSLLPHIDIHSALALRLTSKATHGTFTTKKFQKTLKYPIHSNGDLEAFLYEDSIPKDLTSFHFHLRLPQYNTTMLEHFAFKFGDQIEKLELNYWSIEDGMFWKLLQSSPSLKSLIIHEMSLKEWKNAGVLTPIHLPLLKTFSLHKLTFSDPRDLKHWALVVKCLGRGVLRWTIPQLFPNPSLDELRAWEGVGPVDVKPLQWAIITQPILRAVAEGEKPEVVLDVAHFSPVHFGRMVSNTNCMEGEVLFKNVHSNHVDYAYRMGWGEREEDDWVGRVLSLKGWLSDDRRPLQGWDRCEELHIQTDKCRIVKYYEHLEDADELPLPPPFPALKKLKIEFTSNDKDDPGLVGLSRVLSLLFGVKRETLRYLELVGGQDVDPLDVVDLENIKRNVSRLDRFLVNGKSIGKL